MGSEGTVEGSAAFFTYDEEKFIYRLQPGKDVQVIEKDCIVGVLPRQDPAGEQYVLLYVHVDEEETPGTEDESSKEKSAIETRTSLRSLTLTNPPEELVSDHTAGGVEWLRPDNSDTSAPNAAPDDYHRITVVVSTHSGAHAADTVFRTLLEPFLAAVVGPPSTYHVLRTSSPRSITEYTLGSVLPAARAGLPQTVILLSGDGGPVDIVNAILPPSASTSTTSPTTAAGTTATTTTAAPYAKPTLALLPLGTANALAHSTRIASDRTLGLRALLRGRPLPLPLFRATLPRGTQALDSHGDPAGPPSAGVLPVRGAVVFSWALHAALVADSDTDAYREHGAARFRMAGMANLFPGADAEGNGGGAPHVYRGEVGVVRAMGAGEPAAAEEGDGETSLGKEHAYLLVTLVSNLERLFCISPASEAMDGRLRVVRVPPTEGGGRDVMRLMELAYQGGKHVGEEAVAYEAAERVSLRIDEGEERWRRVCVDGKIFVVGEGGEVVVEREVEDIVDLVVPGGGDR